MKQVYVVTFTDSTGDRDVIGVYSTLEKALTKLENIMGDLKEPHYEVDNFGETGTYESQERGYGCIEPVKIDE